MAQRSRFRPCIDLHEGKVKQIVGGTLDSASESLKTNFISERPAAWFAELYAADELRGGHVIQLGSGNREAAREALAAYPQGLQIGGGITAENATEWLEAGASHVIATSCLFNHEGHFLLPKLEELSSVVGRGRLVIDLSCRRRGDEWIVAMNRWQTLTDVRIDLGTLDTLSSYCDEFLIHAADVEGKCLGIDTELVQRLGTWAQRPITYAGGAASMDDLVTVDRISQGQVDLTIGSALDIFGGSGVRYRELVTWNQQAL